MRGRSALLAAAVAAVVGLCPAAAWARGTAVVSDPPDNAALSTAPASVTLTGQSAPDPAASHVSLWDATGRPLDTGAPLTAHGNSLSRRVTIPGSGDYTVTYHLVFADGSDAVGAVHFSVGTGTPPSAPSPAAEAAEAAAGAHQHTGVDPLGGSLLIVDVVVLAGALLLLATRPRTRREPGRDTGQTGPR